MQRIDTFLTQLQDGAWHSLAALTNTVKLPKQKLEALARLLAEPRIVHYNPEKSQVKIRSKWRKLLETTDTAAPRKGVAVGTLILPPKGTVRVQGVQLTNLLAHEIELSVKLNTTLREIAIGTVERD